MKCPLAIVAIPLLVLNLVVTTQAADHTALPYSIVDTDQIRCYNDRTEISYPKRGASFFGQDAQYQGNRPSYRKNGDGTVTDRNTGLMWQADPGEKKTYDQAVAGAAACRTGGYTDWRLPSVKELYSLILFSGVDLDPTARNSSNVTPFINNDYFQFRYGSQSDGDRLIDSQWATDTLYVGRVMNGQRGMFGVNFADGRIKGYPVDGRRRGGAKKFCTIYVRGNNAYGKNDFVDNGDGTVTDRATGLTWMKVDSAALKAGPRHDGKLDWQEALAWAENLSYAGRDDWRLPNAKELQSIVDYTRSPDTTKSAAIDPIFEATPITNEGGKTDYAHYWTSTTHVRPDSAEGAVYIAFGWALGFMSPPNGTRSKKKLLDVHGAGAQRSDSKSGDPKSLPEGRGPQGDVVRIYNLVRCVRGGEAKRRATGPKVEMKRSRRGQGPPEDAGLIRRLDRNGDGKVSRSEFDGPADHFRRLDRNHDGYLDRDEAADFRPPSRGRPPRG